jgi:hypothetical protein
MKLKWWEKTVEYKFVLFTANEQNLFLAPLDGKHEIVSDLLASLNNLWVLIEFKKDYSSIKSEESKYKDYSSAKKSLGDRDLHHHIVYGKENSEPIPQLDLCAQSYFSEKEIKLTDVLKSGVKFDEFVSYLKEIIKLKKPQTNEGEGSSGMMDYSLVAGVSSDSGTVQCLSLKEFQFHLGLELKHEKTKSFGRGMG